MHFCTAKVSIGGDMQNVMARDFYSPVSWPEVEVLRYIHGDSAVDEIMPFVEVPQTGKAERERLRLIYGEEPLQALWGGRNTPGEMNAPQYKLKKGVQWFNPLSQDVETTEGTPPPAEPAVEEDPIGDDEAPAKKKGR
jgi:hypothetical protein